MARTTEAYNVIPGLESVLPKASCLNCKAFKKEKDTNFGACSKFNNVIVLIWLKCPEWRYFT